MGCPTARGAVPLSWWLQVPVLPCPGPLAGSLVCWPAARQAQLKEPDSRLSTQNSLHQKHARPVQTLEPRQPNLGAPGEEARRVGKRGGGCASIVGRPVPQLSSWVVLGKSHHTSGLSFLLCELGIDMPASRETNRVKDWLKEALSEMQSSVFVLKSGQGFPAPLSPLGPRRLPPHPRPLSAHPPPRPDPGSPSS